MNEEIKKRFSPITDEDSLRRAIALVCTGFGGNIAPLRILPPTRHLGLVGLECHCFLRLDSQTSEAMLKLKYSVRDVAGELHFLADVDEGWSGADLTTVDIVPFPCNDSLLTQFQGR